MKSKKLLIIGLFVLVSVCGGGYYYYSNIYKPSHTKNQVISKVQSILKKYVFEDWSEVSFFEGSNLKTLTFDGNIVTSNKRTMTSISNTQDDIDKHPYEIRIEDGNKIYIDIIVNKDNKLIFEFKQTDLGETYLDGKFQLWGMDEQGKTVKNIGDLIYKKSSTEIPSKNSSTVVQVLDTSQSNTNTNTQLIPTTDTTLKDETPLVKIVEDSNITFKPFVGKIISEKSFFYDNPNPTTIRKGYLVKNQQVEIQKEEDNYYFGVFTNTNGKTSSGWLLKSDITN